MGFHLRPHLEIPFTHLQKAFPQPFDRTHDGSGKKQAGCQNNDARQPDKGPRQAAERPYILLQPFQRIIENDVDSQVFNSIFPFYQTLSARHPILLRKKLCGVFHLLQLTVFCIKAGIENLLSFPDQYPGFQDGAQLRKQLVEFIPVKYDIQYAQRPLARVGIIHPADIHIFPAPG